MLVNGQTFYLNSPFNNEDEIEQVVKTYSENLFGKYAIYLPKAKIMTMGGAGTIPDGFVINIETSEWYVVEAELAVHGTWQHIAPQISMQLVAVDTHKSRDRILDIAVDFIKANKDAEQLFIDLGVKEIDIHRTIAGILRNPPIVSIPIDGIPADLKDWVKTLKFRTKIWVIEKYLSADRTMVFYSIPDENTPTMQTTLTKGSTESEVVVAARWSQPYQDVLSAGLIKEGQKLILEYGPRGKSKKQFTALVRKEGVELDGMILSLSSAAVACIQKAGGTNEYANGWSMWKTEDGKRMDQLYSELGPQAPEK